MAERKEVVTVSTVSSSEVLKRMERVTTKITDHAQELARKAKTLLGYGLIADRVLVPVRLSQMLKTLDIEPFTMTSVERYKKEKVADVRATRKTKSGRAHRTMWGTVSRETISWKLIPISKYQKTIPEFALNKAIQIAEACPDAEFFVDELTITKTRPLPKNLDPFLVVKCGKETYYVEVWDEAKFENKLF